jgi:hypothetical protein
MRTRTIGALITVLVILFLLFAFFIPIVPTVYPHSVAHLAPGCGIANAVGCTGGGPEQSNIEGSITYFAVGYGGIINPSHDYQISW